MQRLKRFQIKTFLATSELAIIVDRVMKTPYAAEVFKEYVIALYMIIKATEHLFQAAADEANRRTNAGDTSCTGIAEYFTKHKQEEYAHDIWLLEDLASIGMDVEEIKNRRPSATIAALVGSQYYWIYHYHPAFVLGYLSIFEGYPMGNDQIAIWRARTGFPESAFRTLRLHADVDPDHATDLTAVLENCTLSDQVFEGLSTSMMSSCSYFGQVLNHILETVEEKMAAQVQGEAVHA